MSHEVIALPGLDGQNPLGLFAALGLLRILDAAAVAAKRARPRLAFSPTPPFSARLTFDGTLEQAKEIVLADAAAQASSLALGIAYDEDGVRCSPTAAGSTRDLKLAPSSVRALLTEVATAARRDADLASALLTEIVTDGKGMAKPTAFHFTAGQQAFLDMVETLRTGIDGAALDEALLGPWQNASKLPSLSWDCSVARLYALRASDPSGEKRGSVAAANWLGVHGLAFFMVMPEHQRDRIVLRTTNVDLGWKDVPFTWPIWSAPAEAGTVASLLRLDPARLTQRERQALGVSAVFQSLILRTDQGGYGSFTPPKVVSARRTAD